ncbi:MAG: hypothetical protein QWI73_07265, partial [Alphaproteobacteria bacterium]|nr:hypothetical protein [Alphaproteobacteria bacterium]
ADPARQHAAARPCGPPGNDEPDTVALRVLNCAIRDDERIDRVFLPIAHGMTIVRRRRHASVAFAKWQKIPAFDLHYDAESRLALKTREFGTAAAGVKRLTPRKAGPL